jgi:hypothetical protein
VRWRGGYIVQPTIHIRDELVLEAHLDADEPHILLRREGRPGAVRMYLGDVRYRIRAPASIAAQRARRPQENKPGGKHG